MEGGEGGGWVQNESEFTNFHVISREFTYFNVCLREVRNQTLHFLFIVPEASEIYKKLQVSLI